MSFIHIFLNFGRSVTNIKQLNTMFSITKYLVLNWGEKKVSKIIVFRPYKVYLYIYVIFS